MAVGGLRLGPHRSARSAERLHAACPDPPYPHGRCSTPGPGCQSPAPCPQIRFPRLLAKLSASLASLRAIAPSGTPVHSETVLATALRSHLKIVPAGAPTCTSTRRARSFGQAEGWVCRVRLNRLNPVDDLLHQGFLIGFQRAVRVASSSFSPAMLAWISGQTWVLISSPIRGLIPAERCFLALQGGDAGRQALNLRWLTAAADRALRAAVVSSTSMALSGSCLSRHIARR